MATVHSDPSGSLTGETLEEVERPPHRWWWQKSVAVMEVVAIVAAGLGFGAYFGLAGRPRDLAAGAMFGLAAAIGIGGLFATHAQWELSRRLYRLWLITSIREHREQRFEELRAVNGFSLGYELASASSNSAQDLIGIDFIRAFCSELSLSLSADEWERLDQTPSSRAELGEIVDMIRTRVERYAPPQWWCFFQLGSTVVWMTDDIESRFSLTRVRTQLEQLLANSALELDRRYFRVVESLLAVLPKSTAASLDWPRITEQVNEVLRSLPHAETSLRIAPFAAPISDWFWITEDGLRGTVRFIGKGSLAAFPDGRFRLSGFGDHGDCVVRFENSKWSCDIHDGASGEHPCPDIELVSDMTNDGQPITEARLILVRDD